MPSQILVTAAQIAQMADLGEDVIITEATPHAGTLDVWVMDQASLSSSNHRSVVIDPDGNILGDEVIGDDQ